MRQNVQMRISSLNHVAGRYEAPAGRFLAFERTGSPGQEQPSAMGANSSRVQYRYETGQPMASQPVVVSLSTALITELKPLAPTLRTVGQSKKTGFGDIASQDSVR